MIHLKAPTEGSYFALCFSRWLGEFKKNHMGCTAFIAMNYSGIADAARKKYDLLSQHHIRSIASGAQNSDVHLRALRRLNTTLTGMAATYETKIHQNIHQSAIAKAAH